MPLCKLYSCITFIKIKSIFLRFSWLFLCYIPIGLICKIDIALLFVLFTNSIYSKGLQNFYPVAYNASFLPCPVLVILYLSWVLCLKILLIKHSGHLPQPNSKNKWLLYWLNSVISTVVIQAQIINDILITKRIKLQFFIQKCLCV